MTISSTEVKKQHIANGVTKDFAFPYLFLDASHLKIYTYDLVTQVETQVTIGYTVTGVGLDEGGTVSFDVAPANGLRITIYREVPLTQETDYVENTKFPADVHERALDMLTMQNQQQREALGRAVKLPVSATVSDISLPDPIAGRALKWNAGGTDLENSTYDFDTAVAQSQAARDAAQVAQGLAEDAQTAAETAATNTAIATATLLASYVTSGEAARDASIAAQSQSEAARDASIAAKAQAEAARDAAAASAATVNLPSAAGHGTHYIRQKAAEDGFEYRTPSQVLADIGAFTATDLLTAGEAIDTSAGPKLVYKDEFNQRGGGANRWWLVDSDATAPVKISPTIALATTSAAGAGNTFTGVVRPAKVSGFTGLTAGAPVWAHSTAGALTQTAPAVPSSGTQNASRLVGYAASATEVEFQPYHDTVFQARNSALAAGSSITLEHYTDSGARERVARSYIVLSSGYQQLAVTAEMLTNGGLPTWNAANFVDGSISTNAFHLDGEGAGVWFSVDFTTPVAVTKAQLATGTTYGALYAVWDIQYSDDNLQWTTAYTGYDITTNVYGWAPAVTWASVGAHRYWRFLKTNEAGNGGYQSDLALFSTVVARDEPVTIGSETVNGSSTDRVTVKFADSSDANQDIKTTFYNRTGAARDLIVEVTL